MKLWLKITSALGASLLIGIGAGAAYGTLALVFSEKGQKEEALLALEKGQPLAKAEPKFYAKLLCRKAKILHTFAQKEEAQVALEEAQKLIQTLLIQQGPLVSLLTETQSYLRKIPTEEGKYKTN